MDFRTIALQNYAKNHSVMETAMLAERFIRKGERRANDEKWVTIRGTHVRINKHGEPTSGPSKLKKALNKNETKSNVVKARLPKDVTNEYRKTAKPGQGRIIKAPGYKMEDSQKGQLELDTAEWLVKTFGGDVVMNRQSNEKGENKKNPEYTWRNKLWELKEPERPTENAIKSRLREGLHQIKANPGGVIMDITKCGASFELAEKAITNRARQSAHFPLDVIVIRRGDDYKILRFEQKQTEQ